MKIDLEETLKQSREQYEFFDILDKSLPKMIISNLEIDYFPRGNDPYLSALVDSFKEYTQEKLTQI